jgi:DNA invertase Pin-like site-specific DNA recombinase
MTTTKKYICYYRVSTKEQGKSGLGLEAQQNAVTTYLNGGNWTILSSFTDIETGKGDANKRPQFALAIVECKKHNAILVIAKLDRLSRNVHFISGLMESNVDFIAVDMPTADKFTLHIYAAIAEKEALQISDRTKQGLAAAKRRGTILGSPANLTPEASKAGRVAQAESAIKDYEQIAYTIKDLQGTGLSLAKIATELNSRSYTTRNNSSFTPMTVKRILDRLEVK